MSAEMQVQAPYEAPAIEERDAIDMPLVGGGSPVVCAAFNSQ